MKMRRLKELADDLLQRASLRDKPMPAPEPVYAKEGKVVGLRALLTPEQRAKSLSYSGPESFGDAPPHCA